MIESIGYYGLFLDDRIDILANHAKPKSNEHIVPLFVLLYWLQWHLGQWLDVMWFKLLLNQLHVAIRVHFGHVEITD